MIRNDLMFYESSYPLFWLQPYGTGVFILEASQKLSDTFTVHLYTGNRKISFFHKYSNLSTHGFVLWKNACKCSNNGIYKWWMVGVQNITELLATTDAV